MIEVVEYRGFELSIERIPRGWQVRIASRQRTTTHIPHYLQQVTKPKKEDALAEAKSMVDYLIGH
jgi:hypothetical protein